MGVHVWWEAYLCNEDHLFCCIQHHMYHPSSVPFHSIKMPWTWRHTQTLSRIRSPEKLNTQGEFEQRNQLWVRQCRASLCCSYQRHCSLCERGNRARLAFLSASQLRSTNITLVMAFLQPGLCPWCRKFIGFSPSSLVRFHNQPTVHTTLQWGVTAVPNTVLNHETRAWSASSVNHTCNTNTKGTSFVSIVLYTSH